MKDQKQLFVTIAKEYAAKGLAVLPVCAVIDGQMPYCPNRCPKPGKHPLTPRGYKDATRDPAVIDDWGKKYPQANVGILTGIAAGHAVLDIDRKNGGIDSLRKLIEKHGNFPQTPCVSTGGGGYHLYFRISKPTQSVNGLFGGIDLKADGGYVVAPPSGHESGNLYKWKVTFDEASPAPMPDWLVEALESHKKTPASTSIGDNSVINEGERNARLTSLAGSMRRRGMSESGILAALLEENSSRCNPPLPEDEVEGIARSIQRYPSGEPTPPECPQGTKGGQAAKILELALRYAKPFHSAERDAFVSIFRENHWENHPVRSSFFKSWLLHEFHHEYQVIPSAEAVGNALNLIEAKATMGVEQQVFTRVAAVGDRVYIDLCNGHWQAIEVSPIGWQVVDEVPVKFRRTKDMAALPIPAKGGKITDLRRFLNFGNEDNWVVIVSWLVGTLRGQGPFPILALLGPEGSAKSTTERVLKSLTDPAVTAPLRSLPRDEKDLAVSVRNSYMLAFTNISHISEGMSDALCRVASGEGLGTRALYTNDEEVLFGGFRPICLNGIKDFIEKGDLLDRVLLVYASVIQKKDRRAEGEFWREFEAVRASVLGGLLDAVAVGLRRVGEVKVTNLPRMADFAKFIVAAEPALPWGEGEFMKTYSNIRQTAAEVAFEASVVAQTVVSWFEKQNGEWEGTATELLAHLTGEVSETTAKSKSWPRRGKSLSDGLRKDVPTLLHMGIEVIFARSKDKASRRLIIMRKVENDPSDEAGAAGAVLHTLCVEEEEKSKITVAGNTCKTPTAATDASAAPVEAPETSLDWRKHPLYSDEPPFNNPGVLRAMKAGGSERMLVANEEWQKEIQRLQSRLTQLAKQ